MHERKLLERYADQFLIARIGATAAQPLTTPSKQRFERARTAALVLAQSEPDEIIGRSTGDYLHRWYVRDSRHGEAKMYLHRLMRDDADDPHDHPWDSASQVFHGPLIERWWMPPSPGETIEEEAPVVCRFSTGAIVTRGAEHVHRLERPRGAHPPITLFCTAHKRRAWGFWRGTEHIYWRRYIEMIADDEKCRTPPT